MWSVAMERWNEQQRVTCVSSFGDTAWSARSPDLTVPNFFLCGFLKDRVFRRAYRDYSRTETSHC